MEGKKNKNSLFISFSLDEPLWENEELINAHPAGFAFLAAVGALHIKHHLLRIPRRKIEKPARKILGRKWRTHYETILRTGLIVENPDDTVTVPHVLRESRLKVWHDMPAIPPQIPTPAGEKSESGKAEVNVQEKHTEGQSFGAAEDPFVVTKTGRKSRSSNAPSWFRGEAFTNVAGHRISVYEEKGYRYCHTCEALIVAVESNYHGAFDYNYVSKEWT